MGQDVLNQTDRVSLLTVEDPVTGSNVDTSVVTYVDDIHAKHVLKYYHSFSTEPFTRLYRANEALDRNFHAHGYYQNRSKQEIAKWLITEQ